MPHSYLNLSVHAVFSTKDRQGLVTPDLRGHLYSYIGGVVRNSRCLLLGAGGIEDHIHLLLSVHGTVALADLLRDVKANSSRWIHETRPDQAGFAWQAGYAAFSVSASNIEEVRRYIDRQEEHHRRMSFQEELVALLERHGVAYDPRYLFV